MDGTDYQYQVVEELYPTKYAFYSIYDNKNKLIDPRLISFEGTFRIIDVYNADENGNQSIYTSKKLYNPTYGELLMAVDDLIEFTGDTDHHFLESAMPTYQIDNDGTYGIEVYLG